MSVLVLNKQGKPLMPCSEKRARLLLERQRAVVHRRLPFTIRLKDRIEGSVQPIRLKLDPGSRFTGLALVREVETVDTATGERQRTVHPLLLAELQHRGSRIRDGLTQRAAFRRRRRSQLRYRAPRFLNRTKPAGWLAPSLHHRVESAQTWVQRLCRLAPVTALSVESVRFDMQQLINPDIAGVEYQQGTLHGYELREYLLEKWGRCCAYCDATNVPLQVEHIHPKAMGGSNRVSNLTLACQACNENKGKRAVRDFLAHAPQRLARILAQTRAPLQAAAAVNSTRHALTRALSATGLPVEASSGGRTKYNRQRHGLPKAHCLDALCVGQVDAIGPWQKPVLAITASGRGSHQRTRLTAHGFPRGYLTRQKRHFGFQTGDQVRALVPSGKKTGLYYGRVAVRQRGYFNIRTSSGVMQGISYRHCTLIQRADGYGYSHQPAIRETESVSR